MTHMLHRDGIAVFVGLISASATYAGSPGGAVDYSPAAVAAVQAVPTLSEWLLLATGLLLAVVAWRVLRARGASGRLMAHLVLIGGVAASGLAGNDLIQRAVAQASSPQDVPMTNDSGGTVVGNYTSGWIRVTNATRVPQQIKAVRPDVGSRIVSPPRETPECTVGAVLAPAARCNVEFGYDWVEY